MSKEIMGKLIIKNTSSVSDGDVIRIVGKLIDEGRQSNNGRAYCYLSVYSINHSQVVVSVKKNKNSDTFTIWDSQY